jgi:hypothetical protein
MRFVIAAVLFAHGIGHVMGPLQIFKVAVINPTWSGDSWLLTGVAGQAFSQAVGLVLWTTALIGFLAAAAVVMGWLPAEWWTPLALVASVASLVAIALFPAAFPTASTIGAVVVDVAVLLAVLWFHWAPTALAAS